MALVLKDRVKETSTTAGTGTITLAGAVAGFQSFAAVGNGNTTYYAIVDPTTGDWEVGIGTYTSSGTTLSRTTVLSSSNSGSLVNFVANQKDVFVTYPSEQAVWQDASGVVVQQNFGAITATSAALTTGTVSTTPANATDIANKQYVDTISASGVHYHDPVYVEVPNTFGNLNATYNNGASGVGATLTNAGTQAAFTADGISVPLNSRVLVYNQTNAAQNGVYTLTTVGSPSTNWVLTRATDANTYSPFSPNGLGQGDAFFVTNGLTGAGETYICNTVGTITFGTTAITFAQISDATLYTAGTGLTLIGTEFSITPTGTAGTYGSASSVPVLTTNASGQVTSVTNTTIAINGSQVSGNISGSAGSVANALTLGTYLTGGTYNGSAAVTATVDATSANTASKVVARDSSGNFSAGTITATLSGSATSATTATNLAGGAANQIAYQSASGTTSFATAPSASNQVLGWNGSAFSWSTGTISGVPLGSNLNSLTAGTYLTGTAYNGSAAQTWTVDATSANTASKVVARDASGNFSASTITAALVGNVTGLASGNLPLSGGTMTGAVSFIGTAYNNVGGAKFFAGSGGYNYLYTNTNGMIWRNSADTATVASLSDAGAFNTAGAITQNGSQVLTAGNYNSYAPTLTGTGASGTWNINVTGSAGSATSITNFTATTSASGFNPDSPPTIDQIGYWTGGYTLYGYSDGGLYTSGYSTSWYHQISGDFRSGQIAVRGKNSGTWQSWYYIPTYNLNNGYSTGVLYAGAYYDANNTSYYLDPASTSSLGLATFSGNVAIGTTLSPFIANWYALEVGRNASFQTTTADNLFMGFNAYYGSGGYVTKTANQASGGWLFSTGGDTNFRYFPAQTTTGVAISFSVPFAFGGSTGSGTATGDWRAPIFYDSNDTGYYIDPSSTSNSALRMRGGALFGPNTTWGAYLAVGTNGNTNTAYASVATTNGNLHMDAASGFDMYLNYYAGNIVRAYGTFYANNLYDINNTAYYLDPASTSVLNALTSAGGISAYNGVGNDPYGFIAVTEPANTNNYSYFGLTRSGQIGAGFGITGTNGALGLGANAYWFGTASAGASGAMGSAWLSFNASTLNTPADILLGYNGASTAYSTASSGKLYFGSSGSDAPSNYRITTLMENVGGNYSKLDVRWYTGQRFYAAAIYGGFRFFEIDGGAQVFSINNGLEALGASNVYVNNSLQAGSSLRAPIFYDSNDTGYYADPNGTSSFYNMILGGAGTGGLVVLYGNMGDRVNGSTWYGIGGSTVVGWTGGTGYMVQVAGYAGLRLRADNSILDIRGSTGRGFDFNQDIYVPTLYDTNNTAYYVDPASTSNLNRLVIQPRIDNYFVGSVTGLDPVSNWQSLTDTNGQFNVAQFNNFTNGSFSNYPTGVYQYGAVMSWRTVNHSFQLYAAHTGDLAFKTQWNNDNYSGWLYPMVYGKSNGAGGSVYGTIYYDANDTGYYLNPNSSSVLGTIYQAGVYNRNAAGAGWLSGNYGTYESTTTTGAIYSIGGSYYPTSTSLNNMYGVGYAYAFNPWSSNTWSFYAASNGTVRHALDAENGTGYASGSYRAPAFYDLNNTVYYLDPASTSNLNSGTAIGIWQFVSTITTTGVNASLQAYSNNASYGAVMSFHRSGIYAVNMGLDTDNVFRIGGWSASANRLQMDMSGNLTMAGNVTAYSDETLKKDWADMPSDFVPRLARVKSGTYTRIDNEMRQIGVGAQSLRPLMEEAVFENADGTLSVAYGNAAMASSVELAKYVTALEQRISQLEARI